MHLIVVAAAAMIASQIEHYKLLRPTNLIIILQSFKAIDQTDIGFDHKMPLFLALFYQCPTMPVTKNCL